jgi:two-component system osmolarity sensor histidine kinase EnvZ
MRLELAMLGDGPAIESLKRDVGEMGRMIDEYLSFARGEGTGQGEECDMAMLIDEAVDDARRHGLNVSRGKIPTAARLSIRRDAVKRCLGNLLGNAQRYAQKARVSAGWTEDGFVIHVDDDGPGIAEEAREHVFRPFFRLDSSRNSETGGTGLGLTIARDIMHSHGGDIALDQSPLGGLRASLLFPS